MPSRNRHIAGNLLVFAFLTAAIGSGVYSLWSQDSRLGWGMFSRDIEFLIGYAWVMDDGTRVAYFPGAELRGRASTLRPTRSSRVGASASRHTRYGIGTLRRWIRNYLEYLYERRPDGAKAVEARLYYSINDPLFVDQQEILSPQFSYKNAIPSLPGGENPAQKEIITFGKENEGRR